MTGSTPGSTRPRPEDGRFPPTTPNLQNIPIRTELGSQLGPISSRSPAACWWTPTTARSSCASSPMSPATNTCSKPSSPARTSTAHGGPESTICRRIRSRPHPLFGQGHQLRHHVRQGRLQPFKDIGVSVKEADAFLKSYLAAFPQGERLYGQDHRRRAGLRLRSTLFGRRRACRS